MRRFVRFQADLFGMTGLLWRLMQAPITVSN